jgi:hypothetical protein
LSCWEPDEAYLASVRVHLEKTITEVSEFGEFLRGKQKIGRFITNDLIAFQTKTLVLKGGHAFSLHSFMCQNTIPSHLGLGIRLTELIRFGISIFSEIRLMKNRNRNCIWETVNRAFGFRFIRFYRKNRTAYNRYISI